MTTIGSRMVTLRSPSALRLMGGEMTTDEVQKVYAAFDAIDAAVMTGKSHLGAINDMLRGGRLVKAIGKMTAQETRTVRAVLSALTRVWS